MIKLLKVIWKAASNFQVLLLLQKYKNNFGSFVIYLKNKKGKKILDCKAI